MFKFVSWLSIAFLFGGFVVMLINKVITLQELKDAGILFYKGVLQRFDSSVTGNDGCYSSSRILEYMWAIGTFSLICICVMRDIKLPDGILYLLGAALGFGNLKTSFAKSQEIKDSINKGGGSDVGKS